ncbi:MAG TPA: type II toxin-antitoxin system HicA family toxin [Chloroflexota bacterium]|nr:type II toxin-antitoxin system HicA family toxin [Chloroflexota bacterium]
MGRLRVLSGREVCRILADHGFVEVRRRGSHVVMQRRSGTSTVTVPVPDHVELRTGTLLSIIRQSQLPRVLFEHDA